MEPPPCDRSKTRPFVLCWKSKFLYRYRPEGIFRNFFGLILDPPRYICFYSEKGQIHLYRPFFPPWHGLFRKRGGTGAGIRFYFPCFGRFFFPKLSPVHVPKPMVVLLGFNLFIGILAVLGVLEPKFTICPFFLTAQSGPFCTPKHDVLKGTCPIRTRKLRKTWDNKKQDNRRNGSTFTHVPPPPKEKKKTPEGQMVPFSRMYPRPPTTVVGTTPNLTEIHARDDWTTRVPDNGNEWRKLRTVPRLYPWRSLVLYFA